jgi:ABC transporter substrate binding protein (PQQ-dependent alcohol dehydrogenase system)
MTRRLVLVAAVLWAVGAHAATLTVGVVVRAGDERLAPRRAVLAYPGHPTGPVRHGVELAIQDTKFQLDAASIHVRVEVAEAADEAGARAAAQALAKAGAAAIVADLPAPLLLAAADATALAVFNAGEADDALRERDCRANVHHVLPSDRMRADALAQYLVARRWQRVLLLHGAADARRLGAVEGALKRHGLKTVATRAFKASGDPRERDLANPLLLTGGAEHDVVWVVDGDGEFARGLPYRTALPRPVVGDGGLSALAWAPHYERHGAPQLAGRFRRHAGREMTSHDWAAWLATKAVLQAALERSTPGHAAFALDGFKGVRLGFRPWDRQLRQPMLLSDGQGVVATAPLDGVLHPRDTLDTLGADAPERLCRSLP